MTQTLSQREEALLDNLKPGFTAYRCTRCDHLVGDSRSKEEWQGTCPPQEKGGCGNWTIFKKVDGT